MEDNQVPNPYRSPATQDPEPETKPRRTGEYRPANFDTVMDVTKELWANHSSTLLNAWGVYVAVWLIGSLVIGIGGAVLGMDAASQQNWMQNTPADGNPLGFLEIFGPSFWGLLGVSMILGFVQVGVGVASFGPVRSAWFEGRNLSIMEVLGEVGTRIIPGALLYFIFTIGFAVGAVLCCIPGLLVGYFMLPTFYLVGGRGDGVFESIGRGFEWSKKYVALLAILIAVAIGLSVGIGVIGGGFGQVLLEMGGMGYALSQIVSWFVGSFLGFFIWIYYAGTMLTIEQAELAEQAGQAEQQAVQW